MSWGAKPSRRSSRSSFTFGARSSVVIAQKEAKEEKLEFEDEDFVMIAPLTPVIVETFEDESDDEEVEEIVLDVCSERVRAQSVQPKENLPKKGLLPLSSTPSLESVAVEPSYSTASFVRPLSEIMEKSSPPLPSSELLSSSFPVKSPLGMNLSKVDSPEQEIEHEKSISSSPITEPLIFSPIDIPSPKEIYKHTENDEEERGKEEKLNLVVEDSHAHMVASSPSISEKKENSEVQESVKGPTMRERKNSFSSFPSASATRARSSRFSIGTRSSQKNNLHKQEDTPVVQPLTSDLSINSNRSTPNLDALFPLLDLPSNRPIASQTMNDFQSIQPTREAEKRQKTVPASHSLTVYKTKFQKYFKLSDDTLIDHSLCSYIQAINIQGRIFISSKNLCFHSKYYRRVIPFSDLKFVEKKKSALFFSDALLLICKNEKTHLFSGFPDRDAIYTLLQSFLPDSVIPFVSPIKKVESPIVRSPRKHRSLSQLGTFSDHFDTLTERGSYVMKKSVDSISKVVPITSREVKEIVIEENHSPVNYDPTPLDLEARHSFHLANDERVFDTCYCSMKRKDLFQAGRLYLTQHYLCFRTITNNAPQIFQISLQLIDSIEKWNTSQNQCTGLLFQTKAPSSEKLCFAFLSAPSRILDSALKAIEVFDHSNEQSISFIEGNGPDLYKKFFLDDKIIPRDETLLATARCTVQDLVTTRGHVYITESWFCYHTMNHKRSLKEAITLSSIQNIKQTSCGIRIDTSTTRYELASVQNIDRVLSVLKQQLSAIQDPFEKEAYQQRLKRMPLDKNDQRFTIGPYQIHGKNLFIKETSFSFPSGDFAAAARFHLPDDSQSVTCYIYIPRLLAGCPIHTEKELFQLKAEKRVRALLPSDSLQISSKEIKKGDDWSCQLSKGKANGKKFVFVIYGRRKRLPPTGTMYQDIVFEFQQNAISATYPQCTEDEMEAEVIRMWDSLCVKIEMPYERAFMVSMIESLQCDYPGYHWAEHDLCEELITWSDELYASILALLESCGTTISSALKELTPKGTQVYSNPLHIIHNIQNFDERQCENEDDWLARSCVFLSWAIDNRFPGFSWQMVLSVLRTPSCSTPVRDILRGMIHMLLHPRVGKISTSFLPTSLEIKAGDPRFLQSFSFNERYAYVLLQGHYFRYFLMDEDLADFYGPLLLGFLCNSETEELSIPLLKEISFFVATTENGKKFLEGQLSVIFHFLLSSNELIVREAAGIFVNFLANDPARKTMLCTNFSLIHVLLTKFFDDIFQFSPPTLQILLRLLRTVGDVFERQVEITKGNGLLHAAKLLELSHCGSDDMKVDILLTIWRLTNDANRSLLCQGNTVSIICKFVIHSTNRELVETSLGCLVALCAKNEFNIEQIGQYDLISWLGEEIATTENETITQYGLLLLLCACDFSASKEIVLQEQILSTICSCIKFGNPSVSSVATSLYFLLTNK